MVVAVTGKRKGAVGQQKHEATVAHIVTVEHVTTHRHGHQGLTRGHAFDAHPQPLGRMVASPHRLRTGLSQGLRFGRGVWLKLQS